MKHLVKIMADGCSNEVPIEANSHEDAVNILYQSFLEKNEAEQMMSEEVKIFSEAGFVVHTVRNKLCDVE